MSEHDRRLTRDLDRLHDLAAHLFDLVSNEYPIAPVVTLHLTTCDALAENPHSSDPAVLVVMAAQTLRYATQDPREANPAHVVALGVFLESLVPALMTERPPGRTTTARRLHEIRGEIDILCMNLAVETDPGIPEFGRG